MTDIRKTFAQGRMNLDVDNRLIQDGEYREAFNVIVQNNESNEEGSVKKSFSNKKLTNLDLGPNPKCVLAISNNSRNKVYWGVVSNSGSYLIEYDFSNEITTFVLKDTRPLSDRVFSLDENFLCTGVNIINTEDQDKELFLMVDNNMEPLCFNIKRAKSFDENGFEKEDIYMIKSQPKYPLAITPTNIGSISNNLLNKFLSFSYRFKFLDGEYSAPSDFVNYQFYPKKFNLDYYTLDNKGMINSFNALKIVFNTGSRIVTDIQILMKESVSNTLYIIETFNKEEEGWLNNQSKSFVFSNNKIYTALPERELFRTFDNVPLKAKAQTIIGNIVFYGNYTEGRNLIDNNGNNIPINFDVNLVSKNIDSGLDFTQSLESNNISFTNPDLISLDQNKKLIIYFDIIQETNSFYNNEFTFILELNYLTLEELFSSDEFTNLLQIINADLQNNFTYDVPDGWQIKTLPSIEFSIIGGISTFTINSFIIEQISDTSITQEIILEFTTTSYLSIETSDNSSSCKTNRDYEVVLIYEDEFKRKTTALTSKDNTIYIPQLYSIFKNSLRIRLYNNPPYWAKTYKFAIKCQKLNYQTIYVNRFYNEDFYVWAKLQAENKDKVNIGDTLIVKKAPEALSELITVKVLDLKEHPRDFIAGNTDENGNNINEEQGFYMKIRPNGFSMDFNDYKIYQNNAENVTRSNGNYPSCYLDLFTTIGTPNVEIPLPAGSTVNLRFESSFKYDDGWRRIIYDKQHIAQRDYEDLETFFLENIINKNLYAIDYLYGETKNYRPNVSLIRGNYDTQGNFIPNINGKLFLKVVGLESAGSRRRGGYINAEIIIRTSSGFYVFETEPSKDIETNIYYESEEVFDIVDGNHIGNNQNQDTSIDQPAIIDLSWFNCFAQGNGVESYRLMDGFNTKYLNIDLKPTSANIEKYKENIRVSDITYSESFVESANINGLNVFNLSTANFKDDLDKQYGSIQKLFSRENDIIVLQEDKSGKVLFDKQAIFTADGNAALTATPNILGQYIPYSGNRGIGKNPESFSVDNYGRIKFASVKNGSIVRLSLDGIEDIIYGVKNFFRDIFINRTKGKIISGYDPYLDVTKFTIEENINETPIVECGNELVKNNVTDPFVYILNLNNLTGEIILSFNIIEGNATITITFNNIDYVSSNINGYQNITIPRENTVETECIITITPISESISFSVINTCPIGIPLNITTIVLSDELDNLKTINNRYKWGLSQFFNEEKTLSEGPITQFSTESGLEGVGKFPLNNSIVKMESYKNNTNNGRLDVTKCNRLGYLITTENYLESDIDEILNNAEFISITTENLGTNQFIDKASFVFVRPTTSHNLYLIWDYTDRNSTLFDDNINVLPSDPEIIINVLENDNIYSTPILNIVEEPSHGTVVINLDNTITYTPNGETMENDSFQYSVGEGECISVATVNINVFLGFTITGPDENGCYIISTGNGSTQTFNYELLTLANSYCKPFTRIELNHSEGSDSLTKTQYDTSGPKYGSLIVNGEKQVCFNIVGAPTSPYSSAYSQFIFKCVDQAELTLEFEYSYLP